VGNSRFSWVNIAGPLSQRKLVSQLCGCPSSAPAGKIKKKFGRRLSQSTLRTLLTFALNSWVSPVKVTVSPIFIPSRCASGDVVLVWSELHETVNIMPRNAFHG